MSLVHDLVLYSEGSAYEMDGVVMSQATGTLLFAAVAVFFRKRLLVRAKLLVSAGCEEAKSLRCLFYSFLSDTTGQGGIRQNVGIIEFQGRG